MRHIWIMVSVAALAVLAGGTAIYRASVPAETGIRTITMGTLPWAVAVDGSTQHAFVLDRVTDWNGAPRGAGSIALVDLRNASVSRTAAVGPDPRSVAVDERAGRAYVANDDDSSVSVLSARSGALLRSIPVGPQPRALTLDTRTGRGFVVNTGDDTVSMLDLRRGVVLRTLRLGSGLFRPAAATDERTGRVFIAGSGVIVVLDARSGALLRTFPAPGDVAYLAVDERRGQIYATSNVGLSVVDEQTGQARLLPAVGASVGPVAVDEQRDRVLVAHTNPSDLTGESTQAGRVSVLDPDRGTVLKTLPVGVAPVAIALDTSAGRAVVVNAGGVVPAPTPWDWLPSWLRQHIPWLDSSATRTIPASISLVEYQR